MSEFLKKELNPESGKVLIHTPGGVYEEIGVHEGAILYTIGQRHGFTISKKENNKKHLYVISKDLDQNTITVSTDFKFSEQAQVLEENKILIKNFSITGELKEVVDAKESDCGARRVADKYQAGVGESNPLLCVESVSDGQGSSYRCGGAPDRQSPRGGY
jgi:tRNA U34 2-thiouridine synthase MnmA/TrmU